MSHKRLFISAAIIVLVILVGFSLSTPHTTRDTLPKAVVTTPTPTPAVTLHDSYKKGQHTLSGAVTAPSACASVSATTTLASAASSTTAIFLALTLTSDSGVCLQLPTKIPFTASAAAPAALPITVTVNGSLASTTAI